MDYLFTINRKITFILFLYVFINFFSFSQESKKILVINSYHEGYEWTDGELKGIKETLKSKFNNIEFIVETLDRKRFSYLDEDKYFSLLKNVFKFKFQNIEFTGIFILDDSAFKFILQYDKELFPNIPIIFCGVNYFEDEMLNGHDNITGIVEFVDFKSAIDIIFEVQKDVENIVVITDLTLSSRINRKAINNLSNEYADKVNIKFIDEDEKGLTLEELISKLEKLTRKDAVFFADFFLDKNKKTFTHETILTVISPKCNAPIYGKGDTSLGFGIIGGRLNSSYYHGVTAAEILIKIINGSSIKNFPVIKKAINKNMFDYKQLNRFNINVVPKDSIIINIPKSFYKEYRKEIILFFILIFILIIFIIILSFNIIRRKIAEESLRSLFESLPDMVKIHDFEGNFLYVNKNACKTMGYTNDEFLALRHYNIDDKEFSKGFKNRLKKQLENGEASFEGVQVTKSGKKLPVEIKTKVIKYRGKKAIMTVARDMTEWKKAQREKEELLKLLASKNKELESIIYAASHDLKSPLLNIFGFSKEMEVNFEKLLKILDNSDSIDNVNNNDVVNIKEDYIKSIKYIISSIEKMDNLLNGLLSISRLGKSILELKIIDMNKLIKNVLESFQYKINDKNAQIKCKRLPDCTGDVSQINQVFSNLIDNALKYGKSNDELKIVISGEENDNNSIYCISDNGIGIPKDKQAKIFEIFYRLNTEINPEGEGLGLSIVKRIVENHKGTVSIKSDAGKGTKFYISLPSPNKREED